jgi:hypothetical protein
VYVSFYFPIGGLEKAFQKNIKNSKKIHNKRIFAKWLESKKTHLKKNMTNPNPNPSPVDDDNQIKDDDQVGGRLKRLQGCLQSLTQCILASAKLVSAVGDHVHATRNRKSQ